jgi:putative effector of murein hydrolase
MGTLVGSLVSVASAYFLCKAFGLDDILTKSMLPKSVTTPFAMAISESIGGIPAVTVAAVVLTGILGNVLAPLLIRLFRVKNPIAAGVAIGTASHAVGTSKAIEIGETEGAMSGIAIAMAGIFTVVLSVFL